MRNAEAPPLAARIMLLAVLWYFAGLAVNPLVRLEAQLGLSPAPWERFTGFKTVFSGMTEAAHRLAWGDLTGAVEANFLALPFLAVGTASILAWRRPRISTRRQEIGFLLTMVIGSAAVTVVH